jgi:hypothetical protein
MRVIACAIRIFCVALASQQEPSKRRWAFKTPYVLPFSRKISTTVSHSWLSSFSAFLRPAITAQGLSVSIISSAAMHGLRVCALECESRADVSSSSTFMANFDCEPKHWLKNVGIVFGYFANDALQSPLHSSLRLDTIYIAQVQSALDERPP